MARQAQVNDAGKVEVRDVKRARRGAFESSNRNTALKRLKRALID